ncbi:putative N-acetyltransferase [Actinoplanes sp. SE50]|uniref:GNAT family N-acetyltransferase n=1 Tax=unclassified Actinoplanes TaxID=2626549 RepID=UPI00023EC99A|nr:MULTISPECIES: GNAT family N-acetyltransferase [unclassified Actinoplanes]AEV85372.1 putative N-acetyltransferase [Actinoplanes sp. SE50/110]ATO83767.1 putative N-acetyltransferase [Actinoplanes sp. SE50]SLM01175.1 N-acetyltransferase [Actinoplanes sp. SE50/110]
MGVGGERIGTQTVVRPARVGDLDAVAGVHVAARNGVLRDVQSAAQLAARAVVVRGAYVPAILGDPGRELLVAEHDGEVVGMALIGPPHDPAADVTRIGELWQIQVRPDHQGRGVGQALHRVCADSWRRRGLRTAHAEVWEANAGARRFYDRLGYRFDRRTRPAYGDTWFARLVRDVPW